MEIESSHSSESIGTNHRAAIRNDAHETLSDPVKADDKSVKETVLEALYRYHPEIDLEDVLELNVLISAPENVSTTEQIDTVLTSVGEQADISPFNNTEARPEAEKTAVSHRGT